MANDSSNPRDVSGFDLRNLPADFYDDPFPYYAALQADSPIKRLPDGAFLLTRYADVEFVYKNPKIFSSDKKREFGDKFGATPLFEHHTTSLVFNDPPLHTRVRRLINGALMPRHRANPAGKWRGRSVLRSTENPSRLREIYAR